MALIRWQPFQNIERLLDDDFLSLSRLGADLGVDVYEKDRNVIVEMNLPGFDSEALDISVEGGHVRIAGSREEEKEDKGKKYYSKEIRRGLFERMVRLPCPVRGDKATASYTDGVLRVTVPKQEEEQGRKIKVEVNK